MSASLGRAQHIAGNNSQNQRGRNRQQQGRAHRNADSRPLRHLRWGGLFIAIMLWTLRGGQSQTQIVRGGKARIQQADDDQPDRSAADRS